MGKIYKGRKHGDGLKRQETSGRITEAGNIRGLQRQENISMVTEAGKHKHDYRGRKT